ncbi:MAG: pantetheine-phosphate adenylyltransferase [Candidatus Caenarcaniphilales bacterium]|nr:pantetheine-phosphate adenylyltransferase [Candidatus Caenarcaniphilales bacterium]
MRAIYPGSFDPITNGHLDVIERAALLCDELYIAVLENIEKTCFFSLEDRTSMIRKTVNHLSKVQVIHFHGLVVDLAKRMKADSLVRGMRDIGDFRYEWETALINKSLGGVETLFLMTNPRYAFLSSSRIREIARWGGDVSELVPESVREALRFKAKEEIA